MALIYEPYLNGPSPLLDTWTPVSIDAATGVFWANGSFGTANSTGRPPLRTLTGWLGVRSTDFPDAELVAISVGVGSYNQGQIAYFDDIQISHSFSGGLSQRFDFDEASSVTDTAAKAVPVTPATLLPMIALLLGSTVFVLARRQLAGSKK